MNFGLIRNMLLNISVTKNRSAFDELRQSHCLIKGCCKNHLYHISFLKSNGEILQV